MNSGSFSGNDYLKTTPTPEASSAGSKGTRVGSFYSVDLQPMPAPKPVKNKDGQVFTGDDRQGRPSIFNRYSIFFFNNTISGALTPEELYDKPGRINDPYLEKVRKYPTASNLIEWSRSGNTNAAEYAWEDFLWCKNYGIVPNNYMVTLRRFTLPPEDDLFHKKKNTNPDIGRMITWVDGETNKWDGVGLKFSHKLNWTELKAELDVKQAPSAQGSEVGALSGLPGGAQAKALVGVMDTKASKGSLKNPGGDTFNPYDNKNVVFGPIDKVIKMQVRDKGLDFTQDMTLVFEYQLRSIDGINPKVAMIDLLSNILVCTMNKGTFWGGENRFYGGNSRALSPLGDPSKLASGDYEGYFKSLQDGITGRLDELTGGKGFGSLEGIQNFGKSLMNNAFSQIAGGALDKMGRPGMQALNSLLSGEPTGEWHITVGNPANPIISIGNLILKNTEVELLGPLGFDDFPTRVKVTCQLSPARPRDRTEIMHMFSRSGRTYLTAPPEATSYTGNRPFGGYQGTKIPRGDDKVDTFKESDLQSLPQTFVNERFPNHRPSNIDKIQKSATNIF